jgi:hypothetical protein
VVLPVKTGKKTILAGQKSFVKSFVTVRLKSDCFRLFQKTGLEGEISIRINVCRLFYVSNCFKVERETGIEPATFSMGIRHATFINANETDIFSF